MQNHLKPFIRAITVVTGIILSVSAEPPVVHAQPPASCTSPRQNSSVDSYFKSLVIFDCALLRNPDYPAITGNWNFRNVLKRVLQNHTVATDSQVSAWAQSWNRPLPEDYRNATDFRDHTGAALMTAWQQDSIDLIAIINRIDLNSPEKPTAPLGEGRLVYELGRDGLVLPFTIILEFSLPELLPGQSRELNLEKWAQRWKALETYNLSDKAQLSRYLEDLQALTALFVTDGTLLRIRTNEKIASNTDWEFRQFTGDLALEEMNQTLKDKYRGNAPAILDTSFPQWRADILAGKDIFRNQSSLLGLITQSPSPFGSWNRTPMERPLFIVAFNSCIGCHMEFTPGPRNSGNNRHIFRNKLNESAILSPFMLEKITDTYIKHHLPNCGPESASPWCNTVSASWNERLYRQTKLDCYAAKNFCPYPEAFTKSGELDLNQARLDYRYH